MVPIYGMCVQNQVMSNVTKELAKLKNHMLKNCLLYALGMFAIREERDYVVQEDFMKAVRKVSDAKKLESKLDYEKL